MRRKRASEYWSAGQNEQLLDPLGYRRSEPRLHTKADITITECKDSYLPSGYQSKLFILMYCAGICSMHRIVTILTQYTVEYREQTVQKNLQEFKKSKKKSEIN
jgi:hypothetical protein